jgi:hypothetical protein
LSGEIPCHYLIPNNLISNDGVAIGIWIHLLCIGKGSRAIRAVLTLNHEAGHDVHEVDLEDEPKEADLVGSDRSQDQDNEAGDGESTNPNDPSPP